MTLYLRSYDRGRQWVEVGEGKMEEGMVRRQGRVLRCAVVASLSRGR